MNKTLLLFFLLFISNFSYSQNIIYKCTAINGEINYMNITPTLSKNSGCIKTDLGFNNNISTRSINTKNHITNTAMLVVNNEQKSRDNKRELILGKELAEEQEQLNVINNMLKNVSKNDTNQIEQLNSVQANHQKNIIALKKELGIKEQNTLKIEKTELDSKKPLLSNNNVAEKKIK